MMTHRTTNLKNSNSNVSSGRVSIGCNFFTSLTFSCLTKCAFIMSMCPWAFPDLSNWIYFCASSFVSFYFNTMSPKEVDFLKSCSNDLISSLLFKVVRNLKFLLLSESDDFTTISIYSLLVSGLFVRPVAYCSWLNFLEPMSSWLLLSYFYVSNLFMMNLFTYWMICISYYVLLLLSLNGDFISLTLYNFFLTFFYTWWCTLKSCSKPSLRSFVIVVKLVFREICDCLSSKSCFFLNEASLKS